MSKIYLYYWCKYLFISFIIYIGKSIHVIYLSALNCIQSKNKQYIVIKKSKFIPILNLLKNLVWLHVLFSDVNEWYIEIPAPIIIVIGYSYNVITTTAVDVISFITFSWLRFWSNSKKALYTFLTLLNDYTFFKQIHTKPNYTSMDRKKLENVYLAKEFQVELFRFCIW